MAADGNIGLAFGLVIAAGLCTVLGACAAFFAKLADHRLLAGALGVSAGVMLYVSFVEIFATKAVEGFADAGYDDDAAYRLATLLFFLGMLAIFLLDKLVHALASAAVGKGNGAPAKAGAPAACCPEGACALDGGKSLQDADSALCTTGGDLEKASGSQSTDEDRTSGSSPGTLRDLDGASPEDIATTVCDGDEGACQAMTTILMADEDHALKRMGLLTALAIGIHNLPEGLATFVAALADPTAGIAIAVAIALHNIPEGVCVAMPVYYATGSRTKGFLWAFLSGLSEPIGGLLGWLVLYGDNMSDLAYGVLFALVAGMMVYIALKELVPTALRYDPQDRFVTWGVFAGMGAMAASLLMFTI